MRQENRLRPLQVGVARHHHILVGLGHIQQRGLQPSETLDGLGNGFLAEQAHVHGHLVVPGAGRVQLAGDVTDLLRQAGLDVHVDVFQLLLELELALLDLLADRHQAHADQLRLFVRDDVLLGQHLGVSHAAGDVVLVEALVEGNRGRVLLNQLVSVLLEASAYITHVLVLLVANITITTQPRKRRLRTKRTREPGRHLSSEVMAPMLGPREQLFPDPGYTAIDISRYSGIG